MKRILVLILLLGLLLSGCGILGERIKEPVTFYYLRNEYSYFSNNSVFVPEEREAAGHLEDLNYLMRLYLTGPAEDELSSPLPRGTRIIAVDSVGDTIMIQLSENTLDMTEIDFSLAACCISLTCFDITQANSVTVACAERTVTITRENLMLQDNHSNAMEETK